MTSSPVVITGKLGLGSFINSSPRSSVNKGRGLWDFIAFASHRALRREYPRAKKTSAYARCANKFGDIPARRQTSRTEEYPFPRVVLIQIASSSFIPLICLKPRRTA